MSKDEKQKYASESGGQKISNWDNNSKQNLMNPFCRFKRSFHRELDAELLKRGELGEIIRIFNELRNCSSFE